MAFLFVYHNLNALPNELGMKPMLAYRFLSRLAVFILLSCLAIAPLVALEDIPPFEQTACPLEGVESETVRCGFVTVPEDRSMTGGPQIRLAVLIVSPAEVTAPDPIIHLIGGPGGSFAAYAPIIPTVMQDLATLTGRQVILFDQRGMGFSQPFLDCNTAPTWEACVAKLTDEGIRLAAYNSVESAADVNDLRRALGYEQINLYGQSYGTALAQAIMRNHPDTIRSVLLESVDAPYTSLASAAGFDHVLTRVFESCAADSGCNTAFPELEAAFASVYATLSSMPVSAATGTLDGAAFVRTLNQMLQTNMGETQIPLFITALAENDIATANTLLIEQSQQPMPVEGFSIAANRAINCSDVQPYANADMLAAFNPDIRPEIAAVELPALDEQYISSCTNWPIRTYDAFQYAPVVSDIPVLLFNGTFDPNTALENAEQVAESLSRALMVPFPGYGHFPVVRGAENCGFALYAEFLTAPTEALDVSCITDLAPGFVYEVEPTELNSLTRVSLPDGTETLYPVGWTEAGPGVYVRASSDTDFTTLVMQSVPNTPAGEVVSPILSAVGLEALPEASGTLESASLNWTYYAFEVETQGIAVAIRLATAETAAGAYIVLLQSAPNEIEALSDSLFFPVLQGIDPA